MNPPLTLAERLYALELKFAALEARFTKFEENPPTVKAKGTLQEVSEFCESIGLLPTDAEWFYEKCEGNGWKNGGKAIKNWKSTLRSWKIAKYLPSQRINGESHYGRTTAPKQRASGDLNQGRYG